MNFIEESLRSYRLNNHDMMEALLISEEALLLMGTHAPAGATVKINVSRRWGIPRVRLTAPGTELDMNRHTGSFSVEQLGDDAESVIREMMLNAFSSSIKYRRVREDNVVTIITGIPERMLAMSTVTALVGALITGFLLRVLLPTEWVTLLVDNFFRPMEDIFVSGLMFVAAPAVFMSVTCSVFRFKGASELGNSGKLVILGYLATSVAAAIVGLLVFRLIQPGSIGIFFWEGIYATADNLSFLNVVSDLIPDNIFSPVLTLNSLQLISMSMIIGTAINMSSSRLPRIKSLFEELDVLCSNLSAMIMGMVPFVVYSTTTGVILNSRTEVLLAILELIVAVVAGMLGMLVVYLFILVALARLNPVIFFRKYLPAMKSTFVKGSGVAAVPVNMRVCRRQLGISQKVTSFAIPLGATINMNGNCICLTVICLFVARCCGMDLQGRELATLLFMIIVLSLGAPIAPGTLILCMATLMTQMNISLNVIPFLIGINFVLEMVLGMLNSLGDVVVALAVARHEGELDLEIYQKQPWKQTG